jgi:Dyp-type peroxidase family
VNHADIQGNVLFGFNKPNQRFVMLRLPGDATAARAWLERTRGEVASGEAVRRHKDKYKNGRAKPETWTGLGLTWSGLARLGTPDLVAGLREDYAFRAGPQVRAPDLGDVGDSAPARWLFGTVDAVLTLAADEKGDVEQAVAHVTRLAGRHGADVVHVLEGSKLDGGREHFGFRDGGSQPQIAGLAETPDTQPGEIVVGEPSAAPPRAAIPSWLRNSSFQVLRVLAQDVRRWRAASAGKDERWIGRSRDGDRLRSTPTDAHAAKAVPAAAFDPARRRLIRRGIPYGPPYDEDPRAERGLIFNAFMASIDRQYEYVQCLWANRDDFPAPRTGRDRVIGATPGGYRAGHARYVTTRAAVYAVTPGLAGLQELAGASRRGRLSGSPAARRARRA